MGVMDLTIKWVRPKRCDLGCNGVDYKNRSGQNGVILGVMELTIKRVRPKRCDLGCNGVDYNADMNKKHDEF